MSTTPVSNALVRPPMTLTGRGLDGLPVEPSTSSFRDFLANSIQEVNQMQQAAEAATEQLATGGDVNPAEVLTAVQKADIAFRMMMQIRNKAVQAYEEIKNIRV